MFDIDEIWASNKKIKTATGLSIQEANLVLGDFKIELKKIRRTKNPNSTVGRPPKLSDKEIFLMLMIFIRQYDTFDFISLMFGIHTSNVKRWIDDSIMALGEVLVKKNFHHLLSVNPKKMLKSALSNSEKSILMDLNSLSEDQKII